MSIAVGTKLGSNEIINLLGKGGMGEVYRARDMKLKREVAIKILPEEFSRDADRVSRFQREAEVLASLNHPNIAAIYDLQEANDTRFLVLELVEGDTLADRLLRGPIPIEEALNIAKNICEALEAAHAKGIIHRDLKPANVKITPSGKVKVLDFGLAKAFADGATDVNLSNSPTLMSRSMPGTILGTLAYMSPEQAKGGAQDPRSDTFAFGAVLYEMLAGQPAFLGETAADILAAVIRAEPDWSKLPAGTPAGIRRLLWRCLQKERDPRLRDIADARFQIEEALSDPIASAAVVTPTRNNRVWVAWVAIALFLGAALFFFGRLSIDVPSLEPIMFSVFPPDKTEFSAALNMTVSVPQFALSPDGRALVFSAEVPGARPMLWVRSMDQVAARNLPGTEDAQQPFWSPDGRWIGFFAAGKLNKIPAAEGPVQPVAEGVTNFRGAAWGPDDTILFTVLQSRTEPIARVNASDRKTSPAIINSAQHLKSNRTPYFLPDGRHFLYTGIGAPDESGIYVGSLDGQSKKLLPLRTSAVYVPKYLLYVDGNTLLAQAFDTERLEFTGQPFLVAKSVGRSSSLTSAVSTSVTGTIAYASAISQNGHLTWMDRSGKPLSLADDLEGDYTDFRLSPDEKRVAFSRVDPKTGDVEIWVTDLSRNNTSRFAFGGAGVTATALWSPNGTKLAFRSNASGAVEFFERSAAGGGTDQPILPAEAYRNAQVESSLLVPTDWSADGQHIIFSAPSPASGNDLWLLTLSGDAKPAKFIATPAEEMHGNFSPDGHLVAYTSYVAGKFEVVVQTYPASDFRKQVSTSGGYEPRWRGDGREIYYLSEDRKLMAVSVSGGTQPSFGEPKALFQTRVPAGVTANRTHYVPTRDGQRFLVNTQTADEPPKPITVVVNWTAGLNKK